MSGKQKYIDKFVKWLWYLLAASILFSAVIISLIRFTLTEVESYRENIEQLASKAINHQVYVESMDARLVGLMPTLVLKGVRVLDVKGEKEILRINKANVGVSVYQSIKHQKFIPRDILISGTKLALIRLSNGQINLKGFNFLTADKTEVKGNKSLTAWFFSQSSLALKDSTIVWKDYKRNQKPISLNDIDLEINNDGDSHQLQGTFSPLPLGKKIEVALDITGDLQKPSEWKGRFFVQGDEIYLTRWGEKISHSNVEITDGIADFQLWGSLKKNGLKTIYGDVSAYQLKIKPAKQDKQIDVDLIGGLFEFGHDKNGWHLNVDRFQYTGTGGILPETNFSILSKTGKQTTESTYDIRVGQLELKGASEIVANSGLLSKTHEAQLKGLAPSGKINSLRIASSFDKNNQRKILAHAQFKNISTKHYKKIPGVTNFSGSVWLDQNKGRLTLDTQTGSMDFGDLFRAPIQLEQVKGDINWWKYQDGWQVTTTELKAENNEVATLNNLLLYLPTNGPAYMDLYSSFAGSVKYKSNYLPVAIMSKPLVKWLDQSIVSGVISHGGAVYRGRLSEFPYRNPDGQFLVQLYTDNLVLAYQENWPAIRDADFDATFDSKSVKVDLHLARLFSSAVTKTTVGIRDYRKPVVDISGKVTGGMADVVKFVVKSPLKVSKELLDIRYAGRAKTDIDLHIPLQKGAGIGYSGKVSLNKGEMQLMGDAVSLTNIQGDVTFSNSGLASNNLSAKIFNQTSAINIYSQVTSTGNKTYLATSGKTDIATALKSFSIPAYKHSKGKLDWQAVLDFSDDKKKVPVLNIRSDLAGVEIDMPYPFKKKASSKKDMSLKAYFKGEGNSELYAQYGRSVSLAGRLVKKGDSFGLGRGHIRFANSEAILPTKKVLYVTGSLRRFYPGRWVKHMSHYTDINKQNKFSIPLLLNMNHLSIGIDEKKDHKDADVNPEDFPVVTGTVKNLKFDGMSLGKLGIDMIHHKGDMKLNKLSIHSEDMDFNSSGRWAYSNKQNSSNLNVSLKSNNLGKLFKRLGLAAIINNGKSDIKGSINWHGSPFDFALNRLNGNLRVYIKDGSIADVDPGAGRVVGLLSLSELPRRLMLDFSDMFKKGLVFNEIKGDVTLKNGDAYTQAIKVESAVADVKLEGRTGLVKRDYDQRVYVVPKVGDTLPVASGVLFGTQIGALVLLFEKLMGKEIEKATERKYEVTGSWEKPVIKRIDKPAEPVEPANEDESFDEDTEE